MKAQAWTWKDVRLKQETTSRLQTDFEISLYETLTVLEPENVEALLSLGGLYAKCGRLEKGLEVDQRLIALAPREPTFYYNLACTHSLLGQIDPAFQALSRAVQLGYNKLDHLVEDPDLANLKKDSRYEGLLHELRELNAKNLSTDHHQ